MRTCSLLRWAWRKRPLSPASRSSRSRSTGCCCRWVCCPPPPRQPGAAPRPGPTLLPRPISCPLVLVSTTRPPWASGWRVWSSWVEVGGSVPPTWEAKLAPGDWRNPLPSLGTQPSGRIPVSTWAPGERLPASRFPGAGGAVRHLVLSLNPVAMDSLGTGIQARPHGWRRGAHCCPTLGPSPAPPGAPRGPPPVPCQQVTASLRFGGGATPHLSRLLLPLSPQPVPHSGSSGYGSLGSNGSHEHLMSQTSSSDSAVQEDPRRRRAVRAPRSPSAHHL